MVANAIVLLDYTDDSATGTATLQRDIEIPHESWDATPSSS